MRLNSPQDFKRCFISRKRIKNAAFTSALFRKWWLQTARLGINIAKKKIKELLIEIK